MSIGFKSALTRLLEGGRALLADLASLDDPQGDYLRALEARIRRLEAEVKALRGESSPPHQAQV